VVNIIRSSETGYLKKVQQAMDASAPMDDAVRATVQEIIAAVAKKGDEALLRYTKELDKADFSDADLRVTAEEIDTARNAIDPEVLEALNVACNRIESYHSFQLPGDKSYKDANGVTLGWRWTSVDSAGVYVPGGAAAYPSTVLMNAVPARIAGVARIVMVVPAPNGVVNPVVLAAASVAGVDEIYKIGGAQAVAALAHGTETIPKVDVIVGPGNKYVAEAKRQVFGRVGIDMIAGPSEIMVISDSLSKPDWIAADLLSQAEHDADARSVLVTDDEVFAEKVIEEVKDQLTKLSRKDIATKSWEENGLVILVNDLSEEAPEIVDLVAPEHLEIALTNPVRLMKRLKHAGAIFLGRYTPEAIGDYIAGPSHVLPTSGTARFSSGLSVFDFIKRSSLISCDERAFAALADSTEVLARAEGLDAHAETIALRRKIRD
jgi:histidinol dehydrogenase